jgi:hypothetical protein
LPKPIHRPAGSQIVAYRVDRVHLVFGLVIGEASGELVIDAVRGNQRRRLARQAFGGNAN